MVHFATKLRNRASSEPGARRLWAWHPRLLFTALFALLSVAAPARAGLYYSGERVAELPSQWRGFLLDLRTLRGIAIRPTGTAPAGPARQRYLQAAETLEKTARKRKLSADESADLGALYVRLGEPAKAVELLRSAQREHPHHFRIVANLATAWHLQGDLSQAIPCLQEAVRLAPGKLQKAEEYHLKLARLRHRRPQNVPALDDLFGVRFVGAAGRFEPGRLSATQRKKLPADAIAVTQQLALWLPADPLLLWQLAELANAHGDVRTAAAMFDGCVSEFGLKDPELRQHRQAARAAADQAGTKTDLVSAAKAEHEGGHPGGFLARSKRPLLTKIDQAPLPAIDPGGVNPLPWGVLAETTVDRQYKPTFAKYLTELDGKQIELSGYMQPLGDDLEVSSFMLIEYPVGCWYCEMPEISGIVLVDLPEGKTTNVTRGRVRVKGRLKLNSTDPENFLYTITKAQAGPKD